MTKNLIKELEKLVNQAFNNAVKQDPVTEKSNYSSIEDYEKKTGKRFRLLKEEKQKGLTREEAFKLRYLSDKR